MLYDRKDSGELTSRFSFGLRFNEECLEDYGCWSQNHCNGSA